MLHHSKLQLHIHQLVIWSRADICRMPLYAPKGAARATYDRSRPETRHNDSTIAAAQKGTCAYLRQAVDLAQQQAAGPQDVGAQDGGVQVVPR